jgi:hypothetical protein
MANPSPNIKSLRVEIVETHNRLDHLARQLQEAKMLEALSQQLDGPEASRARTQAVANLDHEIATTRESLNALSEDYMERFPDDADFWTTLYVCSPEEREQKEKEVQVRLLQAEFLSLARKLAGLKAELPEELELFYSIKHARGRYGDGILISPHLTLKQAKKKFADRESDRSLDNRGKYGVCAKYTVLGPRERNLDPDNGPPGYHWKEDRDMRLKDLPKHTALYLPK